MDDATIVVGDRPVNTRRIATGMLAHIGRQDAVERVSDGALGTMMCLHEEVTATR
ncbi:hypothetical protein AAFX91_11590 [Bradyrhizobium sp. 31Argb]|uniref:hypothetical protein n=1 Tax=Bradyrhizobium sp. 31Argb TaxID=3141247 RepID=UPI003748B9D2